ncbi:monodechloroaminopyrrolnitrin synthase PrnB family protein [Nocardioides speluncae]|uniref:monodechloroaminopyrrolnitrin synthase PrnB family protein n=1 Tax=Nocardioides speluncae TaxID=2670337 RepID=UPI001981668B|nr:monodechloroaminopyrrolnitrin synthase PrnB family protein [Nocardioides speluncae]
MTATITNAHYDIEAIQAGDPLRADALLARLPELNGRADRPALAALARDLSTRALALTADGLPSPTTGLAVMRDLGMVLGSIKRHGTEPLTVVPELTPLLHALGQQTDLVPRDTVQHYTSWNPPGERRRTYTDDEQERWLQDAVRDVFPALSASLSISDALMELDPADARFAPTADRLEGMVRPMLEAIDSVTSRVSPVFFAQTMRPYFEEIDVDGVDYLGPAAAQVPLWLVDLCLWACDRNGPEYNAFLEESLIYALPDWRAFWARHVSGTSLVTRLEQRIGAGTEGKQESLARSAESLALLLRTLKTFRGRHIGIAKKAYADQVRLYDYGSGGAPIALLKRVLDLTRENETIMHAATRRGRP